MFTDGGDQGVGFGLFGDLVVQLLHSRTRVRDIIEGLFAIIVRVYLGQDISLLFDHRLTRSLLDFLD